MKSMTRFLVFVAGVVGGGLLQLWILWAVLEVKGQRVELGNLLGTGGLLFFSTSLIITTVITLADHHPIRAGSVDTFFTLVACVGVVVAAVIYAVVVSEASVKEGLPFREHLRSQLGLALLALAYWLYVGFRTGWFEVGEGDGDA